MTIGCFCSGWCSKCLGVIGDSIKFLPADIGRIPVDGQGVVWTCGCGEAHVIAGLQRPAGRSLCALLESELATSRIRVDDQVMAFKKALIAGVTGQDGAYLARHLLGKGYTVVGTSRDAQTCNISRLERLDIIQDVELHSLAPNDFRSVLKTLTASMPDEIYNLAGQTSVGLSFDQPVECMESIAGGTLNFLEAIRYLGLNSRFFNAGSSECYGDTGPMAATESSAFHPRSPYAVAKSTAFWQVVNYREAYGIYGCTGVLANHESPLRPSRFVTQKIVTTVKLIKAGIQQRLH